MSRERLRVTFDRVAAGYQDARPDYPDELYTDLLTITGTEPPAHLLEVGCGPGKATLPLARMGFRITAIELGDALAAEARRRLAEFAGVSVIRSSFEEWRPPAGARFDLLYAATAWHWVDPKVKYAKAAASFDASGHFTTVASRRYLWDRRYTAEEYIALLDTFSSHIAMEPDRREHLDREIRRLLAARPDGSLTRHWSAALTIGRRL